MTDFGRRSGVGDMLKSVYDANDDGVVDEVPAHKISHQDAGSDEVSLAGLAIDAHAPSHEDDGVDEVDATGLAGSGGFADRGDPEAHFKTIGDFTTDGTWRDIDCSGVVAVGAVAIIFSVTISID